MIEKKSKTHINVALLLILVNAMLFFYGCRDREKDQEKSPVFILALDGIEWDFVLPMLKKGRLPHIAKLMGRGYYGELKTFKPSISPVVWTGIATGKKPKKHGIYRFFHRSEEDKKILFKSSDRMTKAIWNIVSDYKKTVWSIGWWLTYPVEEINGIMIAQTNTLPEFDSTKSKNKKMWKGTIRLGVKDQVYPPKRQDEMLEILKEVDDQLPSLLKRIFGKFPFSLSELGELLWQNCRWAFRADTTYYRILAKLAQEGPVPDLTLLYLGGPDVVGHRFFRYLRPEIFKHKPTKEQISNFGTIIDDYYAYCDWLLGQILTIYGKNVTIFIISDHGMDPVNLDAVFNPDDPAGAIISGGHKNTPPAFFLAAGPCIRKTPANKPGHDLTRKDLENVCNIYDITPTILAIMRVPIGNDMDGKVVKNIFHDRFRIDRQPPAVPTHDTDYFMEIQARRKNEEYFKRLNEKERLQQLRSLGYIDDSKKKDH
jgi:predicted AlkP superfamily phosphohydrolase/phosphomutase